MSTPQGALIETLRHRGITSDRVLDVMKTVPRDQFVPPELTDKAWDDSALPIGHQQTISQPFVVAWMTEQLRLEGEETVLEIGTGSGYQTAVLCSLAKRVVTIERIAALSESARQTLAETGFMNVTFHVGDGTLGWPVDAPYEAIIVTAGAPSVPPSLSQQLKVGGRLVIPVGTRSIQQMIVVTRTEHGCQSRQLGGCRFVDLLGVEGWKVGGSNG